MNNKNNTSKNRLSVKNQHVNHAAEDTKGWQSLYTSNKSHWEDFELSSKIGNPTLLVFVLIVVFTIAISILYGWVGRTKDTVYNISLIAILVLMPLTLSYWGLSRLSHLSEQLFTDFYAPTDEVSPNVKQLVKNRIQGIPPAPSVLQGIIRSLEYPKIVIREDGQIKPEQRWVKWLGGPANLVISDGIAAYLERGNKFSRVVGSGIVHLERFENIRAIIQLTPQRSEAQLKASTKDGIPIEMKARMVFQVGLEPLSHAEPDNRMYPFDPLAVKLAVEKTTLRWKSDGYRENHWYDSVWGQVKGPLIKYITSHGLDEFFVIDTDSENTLPELVQKKLFDEVAPKLKSFGVRLLELQITEIKPPEEIDKQRLQNWEAGRKSVEKIKAGATKAYEIRMTQRARARAQRELFLSLAEGLDKLEGEELDEALLEALKTILDQGLNQHIGADTRNNLDILRSIFPG